MGLLYILPNSENQDDRVIIDSNQITLKSYGLPYVFWGYLIAFLFTLIIMYVAIEAPITKLKEIGGNLNLFLGHLVTSMFYILPIVVISFFFFEKRILKSKSKLTIKYILFGVPFKNHSFQLASANAFIIEHHLDSPNIAKIKKSPQTRPFENHGHYHLYAKSQNEKNILIDRHSRGSDLKKLAALLSKY